MTEASPMSVGTMNDAVRRRGIIWHAAWLGGLWLAAFAFANLFPLWQAATVALGRAAGNLAPVAALAVVLVAVLVLAFRRAGGASAWRDMATAPLVVGVIVALLALASTDPRFPAKRIHVAEYVVLAFAARAYLSSLVGGIRLPVFAAALAALYGIHDEMIQGLLASRTFGLRDIAVDGLSALAGALIGHGLGLFGGGIAAAPLSSAETRRVSTIAAAVAVGLAALLAPLPFYLGIPAPAWIALPIVAAVPIAAAAGGFMDPDFGAAVDALVAVAVLTVAYPMLPHVAPLVFR